ncbi:MAG: hypothetical protein ABI880_12985 [Acidobacteriota bacterium]
MSIRCLILVAAMSSVLGPVAAHGQPFILAAREDKAFGSRPGTVRIGTDGVVFETASLKDRRHWTLDEVRQFRVEASRRLVIETYQSRGWRRLGASRAYEYTMSTPIEPQLVAFLLARVTKPVVTAVLPPRDGPPAFTASVHHEGTDTNGTLALYDDGLAFDTLRDGFARFWRWSDLDSVLRQDRYRLEVTAFEGTREHVRPFLFTLKGDLPAGMYDEVWQQINRRSANPHAGAPVEHRPAGGER